MPGRRRSAPNPAGAHFLHDRPLIRRLVRTSTAGPGRLVLDLGAGLGAITEPLAATGARVIAIERDPQLAARLRRRLTGQPQVTVVEADLRTVPLPHGEFLVVASIPFSVTTGLLRRLAGNPSVPLAGAELVTALGVARWLTAPVPRDAETAWWTARYEFRLAGRVAAASFTPRPRVTAAHLSVRPRPLAASARGQRLLRPLLRTAYRRPSLAADDLVRRAAALSGSGARRLLARAGIGPGTPAAGLTAGQWHELTALLAGRPLPGRPPPAGPGRPPAAS